MVLKVFERISFYKYKRKCLDFFNYARNYSDEGLKLKILFFGTDKFSLPSVKALHDSNSTVANLSVVTSFKKPLNCVKRYADEQSLPTYKWPIGKDVCRKYDLGVVVSFGHLIPEDIIRAFPLGMINVHASILPRWRGAAPIMYSIMKGDRKTGVSIMRIEPNKFDIGDIFEQREVEIGPHILMPELHSALSQEGAKLLNHVLENYPKSFEKTRKQNNAEATYAPKILPSDAKIKWKTMTAAEIYNMYRALFGYMYLYTLWRGVKVKLIELRLGPSIVDPKDRPGTFKMMRHLECLRVKCKSDQTIEVLKLKIEGKPTMTAAEFMNGFLKDNKADKLVFV